MGAGPGGMPISSTFGNAQMGSGQLGQGPLGGGPGSGAFSGGGSGALGQVRPRVAHSVHLLEI